MYRLPSRIPGLWFALCGVAIVAMAWPTVVAAQPAQSHTEALDEDYRGLVEKAFAAYAAEDWVAAQDGFAKAHRLRPSAATLRALGLTAFNLGEFVLAVSRLRAALADDHKALSESQRAEAESFIEQCYPHVGRYRLRVSPAVAVVEIDGVLAQSLSPEHVLAKGQHELRISAPGFDEHVQQLFTAGGEDAVIEIVLRAHDTVRPAKPQPNTAVQVESLPQAPQPAAHPVANATMDEGATSGSPAWLKWVFVGVAGAGLVGAGTFWYLGDSEFSDLESRCQGMCDESDVDLSTLERWDLMTNVSLGVAGVGMAAGLIGFAMEREADDGTVLVFTPTGLALGGRF